MDASNITANSCVMCRKSENSTGIIHLTAKELNTLLECSLLRKDSALADLVRASL